MTNWVLKSRDWGLAAHSAVLGAAVLALACLVAPLAMVAGGVPGLAASAVAGGVCLLGAWAALLVCHAFRRTKYALAAVLAAMVPRMGIPLGLALLLHFRVPMLADGGLFYYLLVFYPVTLTLETLLVLPPADKPRTDSSPTDSAAR